MSKHLLEDMVRNQRKDFIPPSVKLTKEVKDPIRHTEVVYSKNQSRYFLWLVALISVIVCFFAISSFFAKAEIIVIPKTKDLVLNENLSAGKDSTTILPFNLVVISGEENSTIKATQQKDIFQNATGIVMIYNTFSVVSQELAMDTKLEGSNGKIYKTQTKVIVPGKSKTGPGSVEVGVYGEDASLAYNSAPLDFKIINSKGSSKYSRLYARSEGPIISDADKNFAISQLKDSLQKKLLEKATAPGFVLFKDAVFFNIDNISVPFTSKEGDDLTMTLKGTLYGLLFNEQKLIQKIAQDSVDKYDGSDIYIRDIKNLTFSMPTQSGFSNKDGVSFDNIQNINFNLSGPVKIIWKLDTDKFGNDLLGKAKGEFNKILSQYPNIDYATLVLNPMWKMSFPDNIKNIKVDVNYPQ